MCLVVPLSLSVGGRGWSGLGRSVGFPVGLFLALLFLLLFGGVAAPPVVGIVVGVVVAPSLALCWGSCSDLGVCLGSNS